MKKTWEKPKLIILVRGEPGERVLAACKTDGSTANPSDAFNGCDQIPVGTPLALCTYCDTYDVS